MAKWYGGPHTAFALFPFVFMFGVAAQFLGALCRSVRHSVATGAHRTWDPFWIAYAS